MYSNHFNNSTIGSTILPWLVGFSVIIYIFATITIFYHKKKNEKQDNPVYIISLPPTQTTDENRSEHHMMTGTQRTNTERYNPIMFPLGSLGYLTFAMATTVALTALRSLDLNKTHYMLDYLRDFAPGFMFSILIPLIFYARHVEARTFIVSFFVRR